jgi:hypothetical protein
MILLLIKQKEKQQGQTYSLPHDKKKWINILFANSFLKNLKKKFS